MYKKYLEISSEITTALDKKRPVVALESTIISHGMPYPQNVETALQVEAKVREHGAVPATVAIINGKLKVGLSKAEVDYFGRQGTDVLKVSRKDIPFAVYKQIDGATTVAATMIIAELAGIKVFATGGIGSVHRGAETTLDISADLEELCQTSVAVVCAGAKSILDLGLTLEYLETHGVPVIGYQTEDFPAFYTRKSGFKVDFSVSSPEEVAAFMTIKERLNLKGGAVIANPIPEQYQLDPELIEKTILKALQEASKENIHGKAVTPFLLSRVKDLTEGASLNANIQLVLNNAELGAKIAKTFCVYGGAEI